MSCETAARDAIARWAKSLFDRGLTAGSSGNISVAIDDGLLITPTNSCLGFLDPARIAKLNADGAQISGDPPSKEVFLHRAFYETRAKTGGVVHLHSSYATALSCLTDIDRDNCLPALTPYAAMRLGAVKLLDYVRPGDARMGEMIRALDGRFSAVLLANHGPVVAGKDLESAVYAIEEFEEAAKLAIVLRGQPTRLLTPQQLDDLLQRFADMR